MNSSPLQAVVSFLLGPVLAMPPGALQSAYATDALGFILQQLDTAGRAERDALRTLSKGESRCLPCATFSAHACMIKGVPNSPYQCPSFSIHKPACSICCALFKPSCARAFSAHLCGSTVSVQRTIHIQLIKCIIVLYCSFLIGLLRTAVGRERSSAASTVRGATAFTVDDLAADVASAAADIASGLLADLLQLPAAGVTVLCAAAAELRATVESLAERSR